MKFAAAVAIAPLCGLPVWLVPAKNLPLLVAALIPVNSSSFSFFTGELTLANPTSDTMCCYGADNE